MQSQQGINSYKELTHNLGGIPGVVSVISRSYNGGVDGNGASGYIYPGIGSVQADERYNEHYGGVLFGLSSDKVRLWVPSASQYYRSGYTININKGWGGPSKGESRRDGQVRVILKPARPPDFDSGWFQMRSNDPNLSYHQLEHKLKNDMSYAQVKVNYRSRKSGSVHEAFQFTGTGTQQSDASGGQYGGLLYAWSQDHVRIWAPNYAGSKKRLEFDEIILKSNCSRHTIYCYEYSDREDPQIYGGPYDSNRRTVVVRTVDSEELSVGDTVVFKDTMFLDGEQKVEYVVDSKIFILSTDATQSQIIRNLQTVTTNASNINEVQVIRLYNGDNTFTTGTTTAIEEQHFTCDASGGTFKFQLRNDYNINGGKQETTNINYDDVLSVVQTKLTNAFSGTFTVEFVNPAAALAAGQTTICLPREGKGAAAEPVKIIFTETTNRKGDVHELEIKSNNLAAAGNEIQTIITKGGSSTPNVEVQQLRCNANLGNFKLSFSTYSPLPSTIYETISFDTKTVTKNQIIAALKNIPTITSVSLVSGQNGGDLACGAGVVVNTNIQMDNIPNYDGDVPNLVFVDDATTPIANNPVQTVTLTSTYGGSPKVEKQIVYCKATGGSYALSFAGNAITSINGVSSGSFDSVSELETQLEALSNINDVTIAHVSGTSGTVCSSAGTFISVEFTTVPGTVYPRPNLPSMQISSNTLTHSSAAPALSICADGSSSGICEGNSVQGAGPLGGTFQLTKGGSSTGNIAFNADASTLKTVLSNSLFSGETLTVTKTSGTNIRQEWLITFNSITASTAAMSTDISLITGNGKALAVTQTVVGGSPSGAVAETTQGNAPISGAFIIQFTKDDGTVVNTTALGVNVNAADMLAALTAKDATYTSATIAITASPPTSTNGRKWKIEYIGAKALKEQHNIIAIGHLEECQLAGTCGLLGNNADVVVCRDGLTTPSPCQASDSFSGNSYSINLLEETKGHAGLSGMSKILSISLFF